MPKGSEATELAGVVLPANVVFAHNGSNTLYAGNNIAYTNGRETVVNGVVERMWLRPDGHIGIAVASEEWPGELVLTGSGMMCLVKAGK